MTDDRVVEAASYGLKFAAEKHPIFHYGADLEPVARIVTTHVLAAAENTGAVVSVDRHESEVGKLKDRSARFEKYGASEKTQADQQLHRVQQALLEIEDRELAQSLAGKIGVILHYDDEAA